MEHLENWQPQGSSTPSMVGTSNISKNIIDMAKPYKSIDLILKHEYKH